MQSSIFHSIFEDTYSSTSGGAIYRDFGYLSVSYTTFIKSVAAHEGGCICVTNLDSFKLYSVCAFECRVQSNGAGDFIDKGGNFFDSWHSPTTVDYITIHKCAPSTAEGGDSVQFVSISSVCLSNANYSHCHGRNGGCIGGYRLLEEGSSLSRVMCQNCADHSLITTLNTINPLTVFRSNFIGNTLTNHMCYATAGYAGNIFDSCGFFGNDRITFYGSNVLLDCVSDVVISGIALGIESSFDVPMFCLATAKPLSVMGQLKRFWQLGISFFTLTS